MHKLVRSALFSLSLISAPLFAGPINLNTGAVGSLWQVSQTSGTDNGLGIGTSSTPVVLTGTLPFAANLPGFEMFAWANPFGGAVWVGQQNTDGQFTNGGSITCGAICGAMPGFYTYTAVLPGDTGGTLILAGFTADSGVRSLTVSQPGSGNLYSCTAGGPGTLCAATQTQVTASTGTLIFGAGSAVTITAVVENVDGPGRNPSGFILAGSAFINERQDEGNSVPLPGSLALLLLGGVGLLAKSRRRK